MRVAIEGAPAYATGVLRVRSEIVVDAGVADDELLQPLFAIDGFGWKRVPDELRVQVAGMVGREQRPAKIVHAKYVFKQFRSLEVADAAGLPSNIERVGIGARVEVMIIRGLVDTAGSLRRRR